MLNVNVHVAISRNVLAIVTSKKTGTISFVTNIYCFLVML